MGGMTDIAIVQKNATVRRANERMRCVDAACMEGE